MFEMFALVLTGFFVVISFCLAGSFRVKGKSSLSKILFLCGIFYLLIFSFGSGTELSRGYPSKNSIDLGTYAVEFSSISGDSVYVGVWIKKDSKPRFYELPVRAFERLEPQGTELSVYEKEVEIEGYVSKKVRVTRFTLK